MNPELHNTLRPYKGPWQAHVGTFCPVAAMTWVQYRVKGERTPSLPMRADRIAWQTGLIAYFRIVDEPKRGTDQ